MLLASVPTWVTAAIGVAFIAIGIAAGEPVPIVLGPVFIALGAIRYAMFASAQGRALRAEKEAPLGPPLRTADTDPEATALADTHEVREDRIALIAMGLLLVFVGCGAFAKYGAEPEALLGLPFIVGGGWMAFQVARKRIEATADGLRFVGFRLWTVRVRWSEIRAVGRGLAREAHGLRDPRFSAFAIDARGEKRPLPVPLADEDAFEWVARQAARRGIDVPGGGGAGSATVRADTQQSRVDHGRL